MESAQSNEQWFEGPEDQLLCALTNGDRGWLMYLQQAGDAGLSSRNPDYAGPPDAKIDYLMSNGQRDWYPAAWAFPLNVIQAAIEHFKKTGEPAPFIIWNDDSKQ